MSKQAPELNDNDNIDQVIQQQSRIIAKQNEIIDTSVELLNNVKGHMKERRAKHVELAREYNLESQIRCPYDNIIDILNNGIDSFSNIRQKKGDN